MKAVFRVTPVLLGMGITCAAMAANDPMLGQWVLSPASHAAHPEDLTNVTVEAANGGYVVHMGMPNMPAAVSLNIIPDARPHPYISVAAGADAPPGPAPSATCTRAQPRLVKCLVAAPGQPPVNVSLSLSVDGKSLSVADPETAVYVRP